MTKIKYMAMIWRIFEKSAQNTRMFWFDIMVIKVVVNGPSGNVQHVWCFPQDELPSQRKCEHQLQ